MNAFQFADKTVFLFLTIAFQNKWFLHFFYINFQKVVIQLFILFYFLLYKHQFQLSVNTKFLANLMETDNDTNFNYYHQYCRLYLANVVLLSQMRQLANERNQLTSRFSKLQKKGEEIQYGQTNDQDRKKRFRRTANQIERHYRCPVQTCQRSYGSQGSLNQHLKIKHFELYEQLNLGRQEIINGQQSRISQSMLSSRRQIK